MFSIGQLSEITGVKIPTIRYYEKKSLVDQAARSEGNQRRYTEEDAERLSFIRHARELGFDLESIEKLIILNGHPEKNCRDANKIAESHLSLIKSKIKKLKKLEKELLRISEGCSSEGIVKECYVIRSLSDHRLCKIKEH